MANKIFNILILLFLVLPTNPIFASYGVTRDECESLLSMEGSLVEGDQMYQNRLEECKQKVSEEAAAGEGNSVWNDMPGTEPTGSTVAPNAQISSSSASQKKEKYNYVPLAPVDFGQGPAPIGEGPEALINWIFRLVIGAVGIIAVAQLIIGGFQYATTDAISGKSAGKERIKNALYGLALALGSYIILYTINPDILQLKFFENEIVVKIPLPECVDPKSDEKFQNPILTPGRVKRGQAVLRETFRQPGLKCDPTTYNVYTIFPTKDECELARKDSPAGITNTWCSGIMSVEQEAKCEAILKDKSISEEEFQKQVAANCDSYSGVQQWCYTKQEAEIGYFRDDFSEEVKVCSVGATTKNIFSLCKNAYDKAVLREQAAKQRNKTGEQYTHVVDACRKAKE